MPRRSCLLLAAVVTLTLSIVKLPAEEREPTVDQLRQQARRMLEEAEELARSGQSEAAERVAAEARRVQDQARQRAEHGERQAPERVRPPHHESLANPQHREQIERRLHHLRVAAENLHAAGLPDQAHSLEEQAQRLERELHGHQHGPQRPPHEGQLHELRMHVERMQDQIHQLRELVEDLRKRIR